MRYLSIMTVVISLAVAAYLLYTPTTPCEAAEKAACVFFDAMEIRDLIATAHDVLDVSVNEGQTWRDTTMVAEWHKRGFVPPMVCPDWESTPKQHLALLVFCSQWGHRAQRVMLVLKLGRL